MSGLLGSRPVFIVSFLLLLLCLAVVLCHFQAGVGEEALDLATQPPTAKVYEIGAGTLNLPTRLPPLWVDSDTADSPDLAPAIHSDDFETRAFHLWRLASTEDLRLLVGAGHHGTTALAVATDTKSSYVYQEDLARAREAYFTFSFNPNGANLPMDSDPQYEALRIASVQGTDGVLVALGVYRSENQGYKAHLEWSGKDGSLQLDNRYGEFGLEDGWQKVTIGYRANEWIAAWINDEPIRETKVSHVDPYGTGVRLGKLNAVDGARLHGAMLFDDVTLRVPCADDLWVDAETGDNANSGQSPEQAFRTIQRAADVAGPGTTVHILPGIYRESVIPAMSGNLAEPVLYTAEDGPGTATVRGSESASSLVWNRLTKNSIGLPSGVEPTNVYYTDLSSWGLEQPPRFVVELDGDGEVLARHSPAREPDLQIETEWKAHEFWWFANGGSAVAGCDPTTDPDPHCDRPWRSFTKLTDITSDADPAGIEPGNLTTLGNLTGATLVAMDAQHAHYAYRRTIIAHVIAAGRVTVNEDCDNDGSPGLGWGSKYYVENHPALLDQPGEWWFDSKSNHLYLWSPTGENPATLNLEISRLEDGFDLTNRSYISLDGLTVEFYNGDAYKIDNEHPWHKASGNALRSVTLRYADRGVLLYQYVSGEAPEPYAVDGFLLVGSEIANMDTVGIYSSFWWPDAPAPDGFSHSGVRNTVLRDNVFHHLGYNSDHRSGIGVRVFFPDTLRFERNHIHHVAQNGAHFHLSLVDSTKEYDFNPQEIKLGRILVKDNVFEQACQLSSDCGALKFGGGRRPYTHVFRDVLVTGNVFRDTFGWSYVSTKRGLNLWGDGNGMYVDYASGIHAYRNIAYNNTGAGYKLTCLWRDGNMIFYNNIAANNYREGFKFTGGSSSCDDHNGSVNTQLINNILVNNEGYAIQFVSAYDNDVYGNLMVDHNLYYANGWNDEAGWGQPADIQLFRGSRPTQYFRGLSEIQSGTPWEDHGVEGDPVFFNYDLADHDRYDGSWPDFHIGDSANVLNRGTVELPASLRSLLSLFGVFDVAFASVYDIGRYEAPGVVSTPTVRHIRPGGSVQFTLGHYPPDFPDSLDLSISDAPPNLVLELGSSVLEPSGEVSLTVTDTHDPDETLLPGVWYTIRLAAAYGQLKQYTDVGLLLGGSDVWLPLIVKGAL